jgi:N-acyl homoserine lactone hydrolase
MATAASTTVEIGPAQEVEEVDRTMQVHAIHAGDLVSNEPFARSGMKWSANLRRRKPFQHPALSYVLEHPEGMIVIDTGVTQRLRASRLQFRLMSAPPLPKVEAHREVGPQMRDIGLPPEDVRRVVLTHLDADHTSGIVHFPDAEFLVHRPEHEYMTSSPIGRIRSRSRSWPSWFEPTLYDLDPEPYGPFPESKSLTERGDVRAVPLPGHSPAQVGVIVETGAEPLFFVGDHVLRQDWFVEDWAAGNLRGLAMFPKLAPKTTRRIARLLGERPSVFLPAHDSDAPRRLAAREPLAF